jgi:hypothetical protein
LQSRKLESPLLIFLHFQSVGWQKGGLIDFYASEDDEVSRLIKHETKNSRQISPISYYRFSQIDSQMVTDIESKLSAGEMVFCKFTDSKNSITNKVREIYQCNDSSPDLKWMITGIYFPTTPAE